MIEYATEEEKVLMTVSYGGEPFNPLTSDDKLSLSVLEGITQEIQYDENTGESEGTRIVLEVQG